MINLDEKQFDGCRRIYLAANTPSFIVRKMRLERSVVNLHIKFTKDHLIEMLRNSLSSEINDFNDKVRPMILMAALSFKGDPKIFEEFEDVDERRWVGAVSKFLRKFVKPTIQSNFEFRESRFQTKRNIASSRASNSRQLLDF